MYERLLWPETFRSVCVRVSLFVSEALKNLGFGFTCDKVDKKKKMPVMNTDDSSEGM